MQHRKVIVVGVAACVAASSVSASAGLSSSGDSSVKFEAQGPAGMKINGASTGVQATESDGKIKIVAPTTEFHTGIGLRDKHLRRYMESDKHPRATLVVDRSKINFPGGAPSAGTVAADLTIHGVTRRADVSYRIVSAGSAYQVHGAFDVRIADFGIEKPCYLGVCVGETVKVSADFAVQQN